MSNIGSFSSKHKKTNTIFVVLLIYFREMCEHLDYVLGHIGQVLRICCLSGTAVYLPETG